VGTHLPPGPAKPAPHGAFRCAKEVMRLSTFEFVMALMAFGTFLLTLLKFIFDQIDKKRK